MSTELGRIYLFILQPVQKIRGRKPSLRRANSVLQNHQVLLRLPTCSVSDDQLGHLGTSYPEYLLPPTHVPMPSAPPAALQTEEQFIDGQRPRRLGVEAVPE